MNIITLDVVKISYPKRGFVFNPVPLVVSRLEMQGTIYIQIEAVGVTFRRELCANKNEEYINLQTLARGLFDRRQFYIIEEQDTRLYKKMEVKISLNHEGGELHSCVLQIPLIWGALQIGEKYPFQRKAVCFKGYPFTVSMLHDEVSDVDIVGSKVRLTIVQNVAEGKMNMDLAKILDKNPHLSERNKLMVQTYNIQHYNVFDEVFDSTFQPQRVRLKTKVEIDIELRNCNDDGVYLRWINKLGEYCYYLFDKSIIKFDIKNIKTVIYENYQNVYFTDNYHFGTGGTVGKELQHQYSLTTPLVSKDVYRLLQSMLESPVVDMFNGYDDEDNSPRWMQVHIEDGTFSHSTAELQDFDFYLLPAQTQTQRI